jgi:coenzyme F420-reducing hydrogenase delta subunit
MAGISRRPYGAEVQVIPVPCAGKTDSKMILGALEKGAAKVILLGCHRENCRYLAGADYAAKRMERLRSKLEQAGYNGNNLAVGNMTEFESWRFLECLKEIK